MTTYRAGDMFVERGTGTGSKLIQWGTRSRWNHAGVILDDTGKTIEAMPSGSVYGSIAPRHQRKAVLLWRPPLTDEQVAAVPAAAEALHGRGYSTWGLVCVALLQFGIATRAIVERVADTSDLFCSQLADELYLSLADKLYLSIGYHLFDDGRHPGDVTPGDLEELASTAGWPVVLAEK